MTATIFIIHGAYGNPEENWFPWLKLELEKLGCQVFVPEFPTPEKQSLENWLTVFKKYKKYFNNNTIVIGHSLGVAFLLNLLEKQNNTVKAAFFISGFIGLLGSSSFDSINASFVNKNFNWQKIKQNCKRFYVFHSDNDPYVPLHKAKDLAKNLSTDIILIKNAGHFNKEAGYTKFWALLEKIKHEI